MITETRIIKPASTTELAGMYSVCNKTFLKWIKPFAEEIGEKRGRFFTVLQVKMIFEKLGRPEEIENYEC